MLNMFGIITKQQMTKDITWQNVTLKQNRAEWQKPIQKV